MYVGNPKKLAAVRGEKRIGIGMNVCHSRINGGVECGPVVDSYWASIDSRTMPVMVVNMSNVSGDSGGPVWRRHRGTAVGLLTGAPRRSECRKTKAELVWCPRTLVTALREPTSGRVITPGALDFMGLSIYHHG